VGFPGFRVPARFPGWRWRQGGPAGGTVAGPGFPARWPTAALKQHAVSGGGPSDGGWDGRCRRDLRHAR
jgi:hypothetical protein